MLRIAFTGHRPEKLPGGYDWNSKKNQTLLNVIEKVVLYLTSKEQSFCIYTGGALGIDQMVASRFQNIESPKNIYNHIAIPFHKELYCSKWKKPDQERYFKILRDADDVIQVDLIQHYNYKCLEGYHKEKLGQRNRYMVDNCHLLIAIWDGSPSGTKNCVDYALKCGKMIIMINPQNYLIRRI